MNYHGDKIIHANKRELAEEIDITSNTEFQLQMDRRLTVGQIDRWTEC